MHRNILLYDEWDKHKYTHLTYNQIRNRLRIELKYGIHIICVWIFTYDVNEWIYLSLCCVCTHKEPTGYYCIVSTTVHRHRHRHSHRANWTERASQPASQSANERVRVWATLTSTRLLRSLFPFIRVSTYLYINFFLSPFVLLLFFSHVFIILDSTLSRLVVWLFFCFILHRIRFRLFTRFVVKTWTRHRIKYEQRWSVWDMVCFLVLCWHGSVCVFVWFWNCVTFLFFFSYELT